ncbi:MAG: type II secretion system F family protein [archaeon]|nr:type II secretion system F family protein [archaeon]
MTILIPKGIVESFGKLLNYNGIDMDKRRFTGFLFLFALFLGLGAAFNAYVFAFTHPAIAFAVVFFGIIFLAFALLRLSSESKGRYVEAILPDALRLVASNMKSGLTTERALFVAGRDEFGPLQIELRNASKRIASGERIEEVLKDIGSKINSPVLEKTMWLISEGIKSGGQISDLLFQLSDDLKDQNSLQDEVRSNISIYILLILFSAVFGAPLLFGVSSFIVEVLSKQIASTPTIDPASIQGAGLGPAMGFASGNKSLVSPEFIVTFSIIMLVLTTLFSSFTIGVINTGKEINGLKFVIPLTIAALIVFYSVRFLLGTFFGNLV